MVKLYQTASGIIDREKYIYVERQEEKFLESVEFLQKSTAFSLQAHRQMGKTSFINRVSDAMLEASWLVVDIDLRNTRHGLDINASNFAEYVCRKFLSGLLAANALDDWVAARTGSAGGLMNPGAAIREAVERLLKSPRDIFIVIDEFEAVTSVGNFVQSLFDATAYCEAVPRDFKTVWLYAGTQSPETLVAAEKADPSKYPFFNSIQLSDFSSLSAGVINTLAKGLSFETPSPKKVVEAVLDDTGGQPFLTCYILDLIQKMHERGLSIEVEEVLKSEDVMGNSHFQYPRQRLRRGALHSRYALLAYKEILLGKKVENIEYLSTSYNKEQIRLELIQSGLVAENSTGALTVRSQIYSRKFNEDWADNLIHEIDAAHLMSGRGGSLVTRRASLSRIGIINAGGTMGMNFQDGQVVPPDLGKYWYNELPELYAIADIVNLNVVEPVDGVNIGPAQWHEIAKSIYENRDNGFDGFLVITGTDSMAYSASATAFALGTSINVPVIFTGSQSPFVVRHGDAKINLLRSVEVISHLGKDLPEVGIFFGDELYRAVRAEKLDDFRFIGFHSPSFPPLAVVGELPKLTNIQGRIERSGIADGEQLDHEYRFYPYFDDNILKVSLYPGLRKDLLQRTIENSGISGLVIECLGIGNVPTVGEYDLLPVIEYCSGIKLPVLLSGRYPVAPEFASQYSTASAPIRSGAIPARNMTPAASLTKFMWTLARVEAEKVSTPSLSNPAKRLERIRKIYNNARVGEID